MRKKFTLLLAVSTCLTLMACGQSQDDADEAANKAISTAKANEQKKADDEKAKQQTLEKAQKAADCVSGGGQPGLITLSGAGLVKEGSLSAKQVKVTQAAGKSWRDHVPEVKKELLKLNNEGEASVASTLQKLKDEKTFLNLGCDLSKRTDLKDLTEVQKGLTIDTVKVSLSAHTVLLCDASLLTQNQIAIAASRLVLSSAKLIVIGEIEKEIALAAHELVLEGENVIETQGKSSVVTRLAAPAVLLSAHQVSGDGTVEIKSTGANYKPE